MTGFETTATTMGRPEKYVMLAQMSGSGRVWRFDASGSSLYIFVRDEGAFAVYVAKRGGGINLRCVGDLCRAQKVFGELGRERGFFTSVLTQAARTFTRTCIDFWWADLEEYIFADRVSILMAADHATDGGGGSLAPMDAHPTGSSGCGGGGGGVTDGEEEDGDGDGDGDGDDDRTVSGESSSS